MLQAIPPIFLCNSVYPADLMSWPGPGRGGVGLGRGEIEVNQIHSLPPGPAVWS